jgi:CBS domain-containing protein
MLEAIRNISEIAMRIADICTHDVVHITAAASARDAAEMMRKRHVGALVVVDQQNGERIPIGIITDRDIVVAVVAPGIGAETVTVGDVMTRHVATCAASQELFDAIEIMRVRGVRRLPVVNAIGSLSGMVAADDIYGALATHAQELSRALTREQVCETEVRA